VKSEIIQGLFDAVVEMEEDKAVAYAERAVKENIDALEAIEQGLASGMKRAGDLYAEEEYFIPELLLCADAFNAGVAVLKPEIKIQTDGAQKKKIILGVIEGDTHDIGKNLVKIMFEAGGYEVVDLGRDVAPAAFVNAAEEKNADVIAVSTLMTTTMPGMKRVVELLKERGVRDRFKVIIGGGPVSQVYADRIEADGYSNNAAEALGLVQKLMTA